jgi:hypothetical protein
MELQVFFSVRHRFFPGRALVGLVFLAWVLLGLAFALTQDDTFMSMANFENKLNWASYA